MRTVLVIGIGLGGPEQVTLEAVAALNRVDVFFGVEKGTAADELVALRRAVCERHATTRPHRFVNAPDPARDRAPASYERAVADWTAARAEVYEAMLRSELADGGCGAFLAWGDPAFYDSILRVLAAVRSRGGLHLEVEVIPGVSSIQALAAAHKVSLTQVGRPLMVTTGRRLAAGGFPPGVDDVVVMLDGDTAFAAIDPEGLTIFWGAYLGSPEQILVAGDLAEVRDEIVARRREARDRRGWIMDTYLLRRPVDDA
ncbi:precorrin-6A synthase (deacetylating) [Acidiferrimicrobium sp. IK]|uniref:precorrin-6A synthase (deacetylating) n=1 Tax=Acidiferrimicrobium sp. IK TaxID=2871700 RepID=UPI0021CB8E8B|nr:precorrin-6A synthase (deacetylating) [Acidiferrimicrobium sp. IK]MCU4187444.1 precorrin-6A synthase (deacetylating) [Acidiferrimicrobium sp. IK]